MSAIIKFINNGFLVGCGGSAVSNIVSSGIVLSNKECEIIYNQKIFSESEDLVICLKFNQEIILESGDPFISINNEIILNYSSGSGSNTFFFKKDNISFNSNINQVYIDFFMNEAIMKNNKDETVELSLDNEILNNILFFKNYVNNLEYNNNDGLNFHKAYYSYQINNFGKNIKIGVVDSGLDRNHIDFKGKIQDGEDYGNENFDLKITGNHGSHVGGIISANFDNLNITNNVHGFSFLSTLYDFRVFNNNGYWTASNQEMKEMSEIASNKNINIMNNSWGYTGHYIDGKKYYHENWSDYNINTFLADDEIDGYLNQGINNEIIHVFSSGNESYTDSGIMGGLPVIHPELATIWINVVSCDENGKEAYYSNRAGISNLWTITAHGGDYYTDGGVLSVESNGSYMKMQGTSMAAPTISGGLALIMNKFPNLSHELCINRLFQTADYDNLMAGISDENDILVKDYNRSIFTNYKDASELTLEQKQKIFGYGKMNLEAALQDMNQDEIDALQDFANQRKNLINQISSQQKTTNNKFMNSIDKEKILF